MRRMVSSNLLLFLIGPAGLLVSQAQAQTTGACCRTVSGSPVCAEPLSGTNCGIIGGTYLGNGSTCTSPTNGTCPVGPCCARQGTCVEFIPAGTIRIYGTQSSCEAVGGTFLGVGGQCATNICAGACCIGDPTGCIEQAPSGAPIFEAGCEDNGGTFLGLGSTCADNDTCPIGACCYGDDQCADSLADLDVPTPGGVTQDICDSIGGDFQGAGSDCETTSCETGSCCTTECGCVQVTAAECETLGGTFRGGTTCDAPFGEAPPRLICPDPITLDSGDITKCGSPLEIRDFLGGATVSGGTCEAQITHDFTGCGFPPGTTTVTFTAVDCGQTFTCQSTVTVNPLQRLDTTQKGSVLFFSKIELKWDQDGNLTQDTFLDFANDADVGGVDVQAYFVNGDKTLEEITLADGTVTQEAEPGWNSMDCRFHLTKTQPHYWSAANGSSLCQPFTALDEEGPGRPDPDVPGGRILRGFVVMWAVAFNDRYWEEIRWNHLKGDALLVNYALGSAWEYNAYAAQTRCVGQGDAPLDCLLTDENGSCCDAAVIPGNLDFDGFQYDAAFDQLLLDFYASGSTAFSATRADGSADVGVMLDTDLTLHPLDIDLRQDGEGPLLTKAEFEVFNQNEIKLSGMRKCICCWDQTMLSSYVSNVNVPNYFVRERLGTDKGMARIDAVRSVQEECDYCEVCGIEPRLNLTEAATDGTAGAIDFIDVCEINMTRDTALLGLSAKLLTFEDGSVKQEWAGMNIPGVGVQSREVELIEPAAVAAPAPPVTVLQRGASLKYDIQRGTDEALDAAQIPVRQPSTGKSAGQSESIRKSGR